MPPTFQLQDGTRRRRILWYNLHTHVGELITHDKLAEEIDRI